MDPLASSLLYWSFNACLNLMPRYEWTTSCFSRANGLKSVSRDVGLLVGVQLSIDELFIECHHQFKVLVGTNVKNE